MSVICLSRTLKAMESNGEDELISSTTVKFAVIGDFGSQNEGNQKVSQLVKSWNPDFIITTGDNNYPSGERETIDKNIGAFYSQYIYPY